MIKKTHSCNNDLCLNVIKQKKGFCKDCTKILKGLKLL